jgi:hypothetical protein
MKLVTIIDMNNETPINSLKKSIQAKIRISVSYRSDGAITVIIASTTKLPPYKNVEIKVIVKTKDKITILGKLILFLFEVKTYTII